MIVAHYEHRLPADYDLGLIRSRAQERGPLWMQSRSFISRDFSCERAGASGQRRLAIPRFICGGTTRRFAIFS